MTQGRGSNRPSERKIKYATDIYKKLGDTIDSNEFETALSNSDDCQQFIDSHVPAFEAAKELEKKEKEKKALDSFRSNLNDLGFISPELRKSISEAESTWKKVDIVRAHKNAGKNGFSQLDASSLHSTSEKLIGYWLEGLQSTAFEAMGSLDNLVGDNNQSTFGIDEIETILNEMPCKNLNFNQTQPPVRHLVLKLEIGQSDKNPMVLSVLPLMAILDNSEQKGYRWSPSKGQMPLFNRYQLGESAKWPGLMLDNVDDFDDWAMEVSGQQSDTDTIGQHGLRDALDLWDGAFDILAEPGFGGLQGWVARFMETRKEFWQLKNRRPVFALVDGNAVGGTSIHVRNAYRQFIADSSLKGTASLALLRRIADIQPSGKKSYEPKRQGCSLAHMTRYFGHMDSFKDGKRNVFPLDPSQRDALIALEMTPYGELLAVNGPPGTGKTSLLRGVIASLWVAPLLTDKDEPDCPLILACAATNQAVTNIISSFDETPGARLFGNGDRIAPKDTVDISSRWLPELVSYGWYAPSRVDDKIQLNYGKYQLVGRDRPQSPWRFNGIVEPFNKLSDTQIEDAYLSCAGHYFGVRLDLAQVMDRLRRKAKQDRQNIERLQNRLGKWIKELEKLAATDSWTPFRQQRRQQLLADEGIIVGVTGILAQLQAKINAYDKRINSLARFVDFGMPTMQFAALLTTLPATDPLAKETDYAYIQQQLEDLSALAEKLEEMRHGSFLQWLKKKFSPSAKLQERQKWTAIWEAMHACNLQTGEGKTNIDAWATAINARRGALRARLDIAAAEGLRIHLAREGITLTPSTDFQTVWAAELDAHRGALRAKRSVIVANLEDINERLGAIKKERLLLDRILKEHETACSRTRDARNAVIDALANFGVDVQADAPMLKSMGLFFDSAVTGTQTESDIAQHQFDLVSHAQDWLDINVRPRLFHASARYWEGRYIKSRKDAAQNLTVDETYVMPSEGQLRQLAMLAPVFVVTAFSAPKLMRRNLLDLEGDAPPYLFGEADLLIVDEAGQGTPEIGASAFMFARKSIVVGDTAQLEPVWGMDEATDKGLAHRFGLTQVTPEENQTPYQALIPSGNLLARGSVMYMAQRATFWTNPEFPTMHGLTLTNHYRCLTPIIEICNRMVYGGVLRVATRTPDKLWRPELARLGFLVTDEVANTKSPSGSRRNQKEAECIALWVYENEASLVKHFSKKEVARLEDILAIVTPFKGQTSTLKRALATQYGLQYNENKKDAIYNRMVIDTVHSLQGAEKQIVIFAMVDSNSPETRQFYDKGFNLINVAVSRAKEMFIVTMTQKAVNHARALSGKPLGKPSDYLWHAIVTNGTRLNSRRLIVVESPNKCDTIKKALGSSIELEVIATEGHIAELEKPERWNALVADKPAWGEISNTGAKAFARIETLWPDLESFYLATDPDPEGEAIAWHVLRILRERRGTGEIPAANARMPLVKRMRFYSLEPQEIGGAYVTASDGLDAGLAKSALVRGLLDYLITTEYPSRLGIGASGNFTRGIGRVQLGVLDLVNRAGQKKLGYGVKVTIPLIDGSELATFAASPSKTVNGNADLVWQTSDSNLANKALQRIRASLAQANDVAIEWTSGPVRQQPPYPGLNTARLIALAWRAKRMPPARVMAALQALYEGSTELASSPNAPAAGAPEPSSFVKAPFSDE